MRTTLVRTAAVSCLALLVAGCVVPPGDPYYDPPGTVYSQPGPVYGQPGPVYGSPPVYSSGPIYGAPMYPPTTVVPVPVPGPRYYQDRDDWRRQQDWRREQDRREREREADRRERDARWQREQAQRQQSMREQMENARRQREEANRRPYMPPSGQMQTPQGSRPDHGNRQPPGVTWRDRSRAESAN